MTILTEKYRFIRDDMFLSPWIETEKRDDIEEDVFFFFQRTDHSGRINQSDFYSSKHDDWKGKIVSPEEFKHFLKLKEDQNITFEQYYEQLLRNELNQQKYDLKKLMQIDSEQSKYDLEYEYNSLKK